MADHRVDDLSYGHLGEATYDISTKQWGFSKDLSADHHLQQLVPFKQCISPSIRNVSSGTKKPSLVARSHIKWLIKAHPEAFSANTIASGLDRTSSTLHSDLPPTSGALLALGRAVDVDHMSDGSRTVPIAAMACGEAGHVLKLVKPRAEKHGWEKSGAAKLSMLDLSSSDQGHWVGTGGTIQQITFANNEDGIGTWFAVRQNTITTIFRPIYRKITTPFVAPPGYAKLYPPSRICPNPVASVSAEHPGSLSHVDVTFNPWYTRQFAVIDQMGSWTLWDIEGRKHKRTTMEVIAGKRGEIHDDSIHHQTSKVVDSADGWHRILWAGSVSTVIACNRRKLAVFDVKATPTSLGSLSLIAANSLDWILDIKRSSVNLSHLFVLTSSRVFWVEVLPTGEEKLSQNNGARILLSYRHFGDTHDETMKLAVHGDENESTILVCSSESPLVNFYRFSTASEEIPRPIGSRGAMIIGVNNNNSSEWQSSLQTLCITPAALIKNPSGRVRGLGSEYNEQNVKFYQIWILKSDLELVSSLFAIRTTIAQGKPASKLDEPVVAPTTRSVPAVSSIASRQVKDSFVVPDGFDDEGFIDRSPLQLNAQSKDTTGVGRVKAQDELSMRVSYRSTFLRVFVENDHALSRDHRQKGTSDDGKTMAELLGTIKQDVQTGKRNENLNISTLSELAKFESFSGDFDQAAAIFQQFWTSPDFEDDPDSLSKIVLTDLTSCPGIGLPTLLDKFQPTPLDILQVYDHLVRIWVTCLPLKASGQTRLAKFRTIRKIAVELCLASMSISLRSKTPQIPKITEERGERIATLSLREKQKGISRSSSPVFMSSQTDPDSIREQDYNLPTPSRTPSLYSQATGSTSEPVEDFAISRLREYSTQTRYIGEPASEYSWLSHWTPGSDPNTYSWEAVQKATEAEHAGSDDEDDHARKREEARRRRRTERFLKRERAKSSQTTSQAPNTPFGSQPGMAHPVFSSQAVEDVPMTQPDRGTFGSRSAQQPHKKQKKRRRAAGF